MKGFSVTTFKIEGQINSIRLSEHAVKRLQDRNISKNVVISHILDLSKEDYLYYQKRQCELALVYYNENLVIICSFKGNKLIVETEITYKEKFWFKKDDYIKFVS